MRCISLTGSDNRMDCRDMFYDPVNSLPSRCDACGFPDLDHVPRPYYLIKSRTMSPNEMAPAENGNFFVRERVRGVLELIAPGQCEFYPTCFKGTTNETPWSLAVPVNQVVTGKVNPAIPRCKACGEPRSAHPGTQIVERVWDDNSEYDVLKAATWGSSEAGWDKWIDRGLFMSVRLFRLLKQIKARGLDEVTCAEQTKANKEELAWIDERLALLSDHGIPLHAPGTVSAADAAWLRKYLKDHAAEEPSSPDWKAIQKQLGFKLPKSYKDFIAKVGPRSFDDVDEQEGFTVHVLPPEKFDRESYRAGALESEDEETNAVDGVMFAETDHGDCFCFDVRKDRKEFEVLIYMHEYEYFEPYAPDFAACIRRFAEGEDA